MALGKMVRENYNPHFVRRQGRNVHIDVKKNNKGTYTAKVDTHNIEIEAATSAEAARLAEQAVAKANQDGGSQVQQNLV